MNLQFVAFHGSLGLTQNEFMKQQHKAILLFLAAVVAVSAVGLFVAYKGLQDRNPPIPPVLPPPLVNVVDESTTPSTSTDMLIEQEN